MSNKRNFVAYVRRVLVFVCGLGLSMATIADAATNSTSGDASGTDILVAALKLETDRDVPTALPSNPAKLNATTHSEIAAGYGRLPIRFEPNVGQAPAAVKYLARSGGYSVGLTERGAILSFRMGLAGKSTRPYLKDKSTPAPAEQALLRFSLVHAKAKPTLQAEQPQESVSNYFIGSDSSRWRINIANYGTVRYEQVYPGIDWVVYGNPQQLEYDLVVAPNADPQQIRLKIEGAGYLRLDAHGDLLMTVGKQTLRQLKPVIYQTGDGGQRQRVAGHYRLDAQHQQLAFALGSYDHGRPLVIDPTLAYSSYLGGSSIDLGTSVAVDSAGSAYVAGFTQSANFPTTAGAAQGINGGNYDVFVSKLNSSGNGLVYSTYLGGGNGDNAYALAVDSAGSAYVAGYTNSNNFPTTAGALQSINRGTTNVFVSKLNPAGSGLTYSTYLGGSASDEAYALAVDSAGNAYVAGQTSSSNFPTAGALQSTYDGNNDAFVSKLNPSGSALVYSTYLGGSGNDYASALAVDSAGSAYVAGYTTSTNFPTTADVLQRAHASDSGNYDVFVSKLNSAGNGLAYSTYLGGSGNDQANALALDSAGNAYIAGSTTSTDFPATAGALQLTYGGNSDAFVSKLSPAGSGLVYSTFLGGNESDIAYALAVDSAGNAYVAGATSSSNFPTTAGALQSTIAGLNDAFLSKLNPAGSGLVYSTGLGGASYDIGYAVAVDNAGSAYIAGSTASTNFPTTTGALQGVYGGGSYDAFFAKIVFAKAIAPDLNADGNTDLLWYNANSHETAGWLMSGTSSPIQAQLLTDPNWKILLYADFNGDGNTDLLWYNSATGQTAIWLMNGLTIASSSVIFTDTTLSWKPIATVDLNGDGKADLIWYNSSTHETAGWLMNGTSITSTAQLLIDPNWRVSAAADFNGDGNADLLWYNSATGQTAIWLMNGLSIASSSVIFTDTTLSWKPIATADLNGDGKADLIWYNSSTHETAGWLMNGTGITSTAQLLTDPNWKVSATADFNGDGLADLLWHNPATGQTVIWLMNGLSIANSAVIFTDPNLTQWNVTATPDLNGDGSADLVWYNTTTGETAGWLINGTSATSTAQIFIDPTLGWKTTNYFNGLVVAPGNY